MATIWFNGQRVDTSNQEIVAIIRREQTHKLNEMNGKLEDVKAFTGTEAEFNTWYRRRESDAEWMTQQKRIQQLEFFMRDMITSDAGKVAFPDDNIKD